MNSLDNFNNWLNNQDLPYSTKNYTSSRGVLRVDRNIVNADMVNIYYSAGAIKDAYKVAFGEDFNVTTDVKVKRH